MIWKCKVCEERYWLKSKRDFCMRIHLKLALLLLISGRNPNPYIHTPVWNHQDYNGEKKWKWRSIDITFDKEKKKE